ncbi:hypothetical protein PRVXT_002455 [Proteinivorax tanatarense]|uniref:Uncharacterized protein n=1 Tax=Proteinivorax tanatarense TaxID=1260629 RepID=A0AAU7VK35_9FIRM
MCDKKSEKFTNVDLERLNIVEKDGTVKMSLFNSKNMPSAIFEGEDILPGHRKDDNNAGIMFYNGNGTECGGLIFGSKVKENGEYESGLSLSFDQYNQDQVIQMSVVDNNGCQNYGLNVFDRPKNTIKETVQLMKQMEEMEAGPEKQELMQELSKDSHRRMFMGKTSNGEVSVKLSDSKGNERIRMVIDENDVPKLEFLNGNGDVIYSLPPKQDNAHDK